jgi:hypothetical protein
MLMFYEGILDCNLPTRRRQGGHDAVLGMDIPGITRPTRVVLFVSGAQTMSGKINAVRLRPILTTKSPRDNASRK